MSVEVFLAKLLAAIWGYSNKGRQTFRLSELLNKGPVQTTLSKLVVPNLKSGYVNASVQFSFNSFRDFS